MNKIPMPFLCMPVAIYENEQMLFHFVSVLEAPPTGYLHCVYFKIERKLILESTTGK